MYCKKCGNKIDDNSRFCRFCGEPTEKEKDFKESVSENKSGLGDFWKAIIITVSIVAIVFVASYFFFDFSYEYKKGNYEKIAEKYPVTKAHEMDYEKKLKIIDSYIKAGRGDEVHDELKEVFKDNSVLNFKTPLEARLYIAYLKNEIDDFDFKEPFKFLSKPFQENEILDSGRKEILEMFEKMNPEKLVDYVTENYKKIDFNALVDNVEKEIAESAELEAMKETINNVYDSINDYGKKATKAIFDFSNEQAKNVKNGAEKSWETINNAYKKNMDSVNKFFQSENMKKLSGFMGKEKFEEMFSKSVEATTDFSKKSYEKIGNGYEMGKVAMQNFLKESEEYLKNTNVYDFLKSTSSDIWKIFKPGDSKK